jgi:hypothetical protein
LARIVVGPNVQVSGARAAEPHNEVVAAADPAHPGWLLACSMLDPGPRGSMKTAAYVSTDGGRTWSAPVVSSEFRANDPTCAYGPDGVGYLVHKGYDGTRPARGVRSDDDYLVVHRALNGGRHWDAPVRGPQANDRPFIAVDTRSARWRGRMYVAYNGHIHGETEAHDDTCFRNTVVLQASADGGKTFTTYAARALMDQREGRRVNAAMAGAAVLSDGTVAVLYVHQVMGAPQATGKLTELQATLRVLRSADGGASFEPASIVAATTTSYNVPAARGVPASLAVDPGSARFADRLYVAWADYSTGHGRILVAVSADSGKTWSAPHRVSDDSAARPTNDGPDDFMATVAVNENGVVGVLWYDRRDAANHADYAVRFAASVDGGATWTPSVRVSAASNAKENQHSGSPFFVNGGDTAGLTATADGRFHALWIDNRTGVQQVWTAPITVTP